MTARRRLAALAVCLAILGGCISAGQVAPEVRALQALQDVATIRTVTMRAAGEAVALGKITDAQLRTVVLPLGDALLAAQDAGAAALDFYLASQVRDERRLDAAIAAAVDAATALVQAANQIGAN